MNRRLEKAFGKFMRIASDEASKSDVGPNEVSVLFVEALGIMLGVASNETIEEAAETLKQGIITCAYRARENDQVVEMLAQGAAMKWH
jgi:hypothetical protein